MRILLLNDAATPGGGAELLTIALREELRKRGHDARLFASTAQYGSGESHADYSCYGTTSTLRTINRVINISAFYRLRDILEKFRPDVVHVRMFLTQLSPLILPLLRQVPSIYHATWHETICPTGLKILPDGSSCTEAAGLACRRNGCLSRRAWPVLMLQLALWQRWRQAFDYIVANSESLAKTLRTYDVEANEVIWNGVPIHPPRPPLLDPPTISFAGRLTKEKGVTVLLYAFADVRKHVPEARLLLAGDGDQKEELRRLITKLELDSSVFLLNHLTRPDLEDQLSPAWVHVVPSQCPESFGLTAAEAMMRGTAVIASDIGGLSELVEHDRTGLLLPSGDKQSLATALITVLQDRALAEEMGAAGRLRALAHMSEARFAERFIELYTSLSQARA